MATTAVRRAERTERFATRAGRAILQVWVRAAMFPVCDDMRIANQRLGPWLKNLYPEVSLPVSCLRSDWLAPAGVIDIRVLGLLDWV